MSEANEGERKGKRRAIGQVEWADFIEAIGGRGSEMGRKLLGFNVIEEGVANLDVAGLIVVSLEFEAKEFFEEVGNVFVEMLPLTERW